MLKFEKGKDEQRRMHGLAHDHASGAETGGLCRWRENEGEMEVCLDDPNLDFGTEITTKSKLRALQIA